MGLSENWNIKVNYEEMKKRKMKFDPILIIDPKNNERKHGDWYIQDGNHRALAYTMALLKEEAVWEDQRVYCATNTEFS